ncbi:ABC transporter substrate-binding protein [Nocardioides pelophilus]|uniref:ABC transporter substrate-binding protein n=1 Tax=Nocardioides pelophilus TaxID=2172019 RepID=UPI0015FF3A29|nr:ABC transporter substrate-binding protein [Nocardioides pelophilus]
MVRARNAVVATTMIILLAACGSRLDPETVAQAGGQQPGVDPAADTVPGADPGSDVGPGADTGAGPGTDSGSGSDPGSDPGADPDADTGAPGTDDDATGNTKKASCDGFKNTTGITDDKIVLANVADISGPVPGIFEASQLAVRAYAAFFNSQGDICGRKLEVLPLDSRADAGADQQAYAKACEDAFAAVGSMGAFDSGGVGPAEGCGLPDIRTVSTTSERGACSTCFATYATQPFLIPDSYAKWFMKEHKDATESVGVLWINGGAAPENANYQADAWEKIGWEVDYRQGIDVAEFNFAPYVQQLKDKGIKMVVYTGPYQNTVKLQQAMQQQGYKPDVYLQDPTIYDARYVEQAGSLAEDVYVYSTTDLFENRSNSEIQTYLSWLQQVKPGADPNFYGLYAWSAARLFVEKAIGLGGKLSRSTMIGELAGTKAWTGNGAHSPQNVGGRVTSPCTMVIQYSGGWRKVSPGDFMCGQVVNAK